MGNETIQKDKTIGITARYIFRKPVSVRCTGNTSLEVEFREGVVKQIDLATLAEDIPVFNDLFADQTLFSQAKCQGYGIVWNDEIDISAEYIWDNGVTVRTVFDGLLSMKEATEQWGINESTIRKAIAAGRFEEGVDVKKYGKQWVLSRGAVEREYGPALADIKEGYEYPGHVMRRVEKAQKHS